MRQFTLVLAAVVALGLKTTTQEARHSTPRTSSPSSSARVAPLIGAGVTFLAALDHRRDPPLSVDRCCTRAEAAPGAAFREPVFGGAVDQLREWTVVVVALLQTAPARGVIRLANHLGRPPVDVEKQCHIGV